MKVSSVVDGGAFWFDETLTFPNDENGNEGIIVYEREHGEVMDDEMTWERSVTNRVFMKWQEGEFTPNVRELDFDQD